MIITIVVLIILAGVAINLTLGDSGIFNKAKYAKLKYINEKSEEEVKIGKIVNEMDTITSNREDILNNEFFFFSKNGFSQITGKSNINSLNGLYATEYENSNVELIERWEKMCKLEKNTNIDLSKEFEISFKNKLITTNNNQMGGFQIILMKKNNEGSYDNIYTISLSDCWVASSEIWIKLSGSTNNTIGNKIITASRFIETCALVGDGTNIKLYYDDTVVATTPVQNIKCDKIAIIFAHSKDYPIASNNSLQQLYIGPIKYYKDVINQ